MFGLLYIFLRAPESATWRGGIGPLRERPRSLERGRTGMYGFPGMGVQFGCGTRHVCRLVGLDLGHSGNYCRPDFWGGLLR